MKVFKGVLFSLGGPIWVFQRLKWLLLRSRGGRHPNLIIVYASEVHTGTRLDWKASKFEFDFKLAWNGCFCSDLSSLKTKKVQKGQKYLPLMPEILKSAPAVIKNICCGVVSHLNIYIHLAYYNRYKCLETPQLHLLGQDILSQMSNLTFIM